MTQYDPESMTARFFEAAELTLRELDQVRAALKQDASLAPKHDESLARFYVYNYLYRRPALTSSEVLVSELNWLRSSTLPENIGALDYEYFECCRQSCIDALIAETVAPQS